MASVQSTVTLHPLGNYTFGVKEAQPEEDPSVAARLKRLENEYETAGMRRSVEAILVVHEHGHPHVLMMQIANTFFKLPGSYLKPGEDEVEGLKMRLHQQLSPPGPYDSAEWEIGELLAVWWRPNFETFMVKLHARPRFANADHLNDNFSQYPYVPAHITYPKEQKKLFIIHLPERKLLSVPKNMKLLAVPLFELYDNSARYGPQLSAIPHILSRFNFVTA